MQHKKIIFLCTMIISMSIVNIFADTFQFRAPPGGVYLNASFEQSSTDIISITVEHQGAAISQWFIAADEGTSSDFEPRELYFSSNSLDYQIYKSAPPSSDIIKSPPEVLSLPNVISTADFSSDSAGMEQQSYNLFFHINSAQFIPAGTYSDTITLYLYTGDYADSGTHTLVDSLNVIVYGRMAELLDIYSIREPGIRFMDLTITQTDKLIATVNERSNSATGYTVSVTSKNLANDGGGASQPYFLNSTSAGQLTYSLNYDSTAVGPWLSGTARLTDSTLTTTPEWLSKPLTINYSGSTALPAGDYEDILTLTISAK
jgi:spore coat protein U-like protein